MLEGRWQPEAARAQGPMSVTDEDLARIELCLPVDDSFSVQWMGKCGDKTFDSDDIRALVDEVRRLRMLYKVADAQLERFRSGDQVEEMAQTIAEIAAEDRTCQDCLCDGSEQGWVCVICAKVRVCPNDCFDAHANLYLNEASCHCCISGHRPEMAAKLDKANAALRLLAWGTRLGVLHFSENCFGDKPDPCPDYCEAGRAALREYGHGETDFEKDGGAF